MVFIGYYACLSLFDGISCARVALDRASINVDKYYASEIDKYAIQVSEKNYPDIIRIGDVKQVSKIQNMDLLIGGSPCFLAGTLIQTNKGLKNIEDIEVGDFVITHTNSFQKVLRIGGKSVDGYLNLKIQGSPETLVTKNHRYYVRTMSRIFDSNIRSYIRVFTDPYWKEADLLNKNDFIGFAINNNCSNVMGLSSEECWLIGRYIADGYIRDGKRPHRINSYNNQVIYCVGKNKIEHFKNNINTYYAGYTDERTVCKARIINKRLKDLCGYAGKGAHNKIIPQFVLDLPNDLLEHFLDGYISGDGYTSGNNINANTVSIKLAYQLAQVVYKLYKTPCSIFKNKHKPTSIIEGRTVN